MNDKLLALLGFASKANKLSYGFDAVCATLSKNKSELVLTANDISEKSKKEVLFFCNKFKTKMLALNECDMQTLSHAIGHKCAVISVNDISFANGIQNAVENHAGRKLNDKQIQNQ